MTARKLTLAVLFTFVCSALLPAAELSTLTGKKYKGELARFDGKLLTFTADIGTVAVPVKELFVLDFGNKSVDLTKEVKFDEIELTDGTILRSTAFKLKGKVFELALLSNAMLPMPTAEVALSHVFSVMRSAEAKKNQDDWKKLLTTRGKRDMFVIKQADGLNALAGTVIEGSADGDSLTFEKEDGTRSALKLTRASGGLVLNPPPRDAIPPTICKVYDVFGNILFATKLDVIPGGTVTVTTVAGAVVKYASTAGLWKLDFSQGNIAYLSDLLPIVAAPKAEPDSAIVPYTKDRTADNNAIKLDGVNYARGISILPDTTLTYKLGGDFREFRGIVGIDESIESTSATAKLTIEADGRVLFTGSIARKAKVKEMVLDVKGIKELKISVEREGLYLGDQVLLAEARLMK